MEPPELPLYLQRLLDIITRLGKCIPENEACLEKCRKYVIKHIDKPVGIAQYFQSFETEHRLNDTQQLLLAACLAPYSVPGLYYTLAIETLSEKNNALGLVNDQHTAILYPTVQTLLFILNGASGESCTGTATSILNDRIFENGLLQAGALPNLIIKNNLLNHVVSVGDDFLNYFFTGEDGTPGFSASFPARKITTGLNWKDLVLDAATLAQVREITSWHKHKNVVLNQWNLNKMLNPGYKLLFYGPPGTGKSLTAALMGQELGVDVFRIDLSMVVSKYIGETEKNLSTLFDRAMSKNWILFFDEADALFGSRTEVRDSHDRYANQEVSYLLQRLENYNGIVILASNLKGNIDKAFSRRFQNMIRFRVPDAEQRRLLWSNSFSQATVLENNLSINDLARMYEVTGGNIINVVQYASLKAAERGNNVIMGTDVKTGIIRELSKEGKTL